MKDSEYELHEIAKLLPTLTRKIVDLENELQESEAKNALSRMFSSKRNPGQTRAERDRIMRDIEQKEKAETRIESRLPLQKKEIKSLKKSAEESIAWLEINPSEKHIESKRGAKLQEQSEIQKQLTALQEEISGKKKELLENARVIACTAYKIAKKSREGIEGFRVRAT